jgi:integrase
VRLDELVRLLLSDYRLQRRPSTERARYALDHVIAYFGEDVDAGKLGYDRFVAYATARFAADPPAAPATVRQELALLRRAFRLAERSEKVATPAFPTIRVDNARQGFIDREAFDCLLDCLPAYLVPVATFLYVTGWRRQEALGLTWRQVDFEQGVVRLEPGTTKNRDGREFPFFAFPELERVLGEQRAETKRVELEQATVIPWVFHYPDGRRLNDFRNAWKTACKRCGIAGAVLHDFRRSAVRNLERAGVERQTAMKLTGHRTESIYARYAISNRADLEAGVRRLAALFERDATSTQRVFSLDTKHGQRYGQTFFDEKKGRGGR